MQFYTPPTPQTPSNPWATNGENAAAGNAYQPGVIPTQTAGTAPSGTQSAVQGLPFGNLQNNQLGTAQWGTGASFQGAAQQAAIGALEAGMGTQNPQDASSMDSLRQYYGQQLAQLPQQSVDNQSIFDTQQQQGLAQALQANKNAAAGSGSLGSRQFQAQQAGTTANAAQNYASGLSDLNATSLGEANMLAGGLQGVNTSDLNNQQANLGQGYSLAQAIAQQQNQALVNSGIAQNQQQYNDSTTQGIFQGFMSPIAGVFGAAKSA